MSVRLRVATLAFLLAGCGSDSNSKAKVASPVAPIEDIEVHAQRLAQEIIIADGHIDLPYRLRSLAEEGKSSPDLSIAGDEGQFDAARANAGGLNAPFMSIYVPSKYQEQGGAKQVADELIDSVENIISKWPTQFAKALTPAEVEANFKSGHISLLMGIENGAALESDLKNVEHFFKRGVRYITLTHAKDNLICDSSYDDAHTHGGLSAFGAEIVREMNRVGIVVDISHVSDATFFDVMKISSKPVIASHSSMRHFTPGFERNMSDDMVRALAENGGVVMINFGSTFISQTAIDWRAEQKDAEAAFKTKTPTADDKAVEAYGEVWATEHPFPFASVGDVANHIDRVVGLVGVEHVGFGSDFDGVGDSLPVGLKDAADYPKLIKVLIERGYTDGEIEQIASGNVLRVWRAQANSQ